MEEVFIAKVKAVVASPHGNLLRQLVDVLYQQVDAYDDEPLTPDDQAAIQQGEVDIRAGRTISWEALKKELNL